MGRTLEMFDKPPRAKRRVLMYVCDAGDCACGMDDESSAIVQFSCKRCGHVSEWMRGLSIAEAKRGIPCPECAKP